MSFQVVVRPRVWKREMIFSPSDCACDGGRGEGAQGVFWWGIEMLRACVRREWRRSRRSERKRGILKLLVWPNCTVVWKECKRGWNYSFWCLFSIHGDVAFWMTEFVEIFGGRREDADPIRLGYALTCVQHIYGNEREIASSTGLTSRRDGTKLWRVTEEINTLAK